MDQVSKSFVELQHLLIYKDKAPEFIFTSLPVN